MHISIPAARPRAIALAVRAAICLPCTTIAYAQGVATDQQLAPTVVVTGQIVRSGLANGVPSTSVSKTADDLREQNLVNPEDALKYVPNTTIRKRYIGDRNALIGGRSFGTLQPSRALVYVDGLLISNFLGRFDAPRWNMVTPETIARVDVLYGPFSAIYPGNSIGTTVAITEREPRRFEASGRLTGYRQQFKQYGQDGHYDGHQASVHLGARLDSGLWFTGAFNRQDSTSQPMQYYAISANATTGQFPAVSGAATRVDGIAYDTDPKGARRAVFGANSGAIDHTLQHTAKFKAGYAFTPEVVASAMLGLWTNDTTNTNRTHLRDEQGQPVWSGKVTDGVNTFSIPATAFAPSERNEQHRHAGASLKTRRKSGWNGSIVYSNYRITEDITRQAQQPDPVAANGGLGTWTLRDGTGWDTFEVQAAYTPQAGDWGGGRHSLTAGLHRNAYRLDSPTYNASDWRQTPTTLAQRYQGHTEVTAAYAQDAWKLPHDLTLTLGARLERFRAADGRQLVRTPQCTAGVVSGGQVGCEAVDGGQYLRTLDYDARELRGSSPKASLAWRAAPDLLLKASAGRGVRFPNVEELYNGTFTATSQSLSDPDLRAERANAFELSAERDFDLHRVRVSIFHDDVRDAILRQSDTTVVPTVTRVSNVDRVRTRGIEVVFQSQDLFVRGLSLDANAAFAHSKVVENARDPASEGKWWLRVPKVRANAMATWRPTTQWMGSLGVRHSGRAYNDTYNLDVNPNVYGGVSAYTFTDLRLAYKPAGALEYAVGIDNLLDKRGFQSHPYPGRTLFAEVRFSL